MMKKLSMLAFGAALALAGCGGGDAPKTGCDGMGTKMKEWSKKEEAEAMKELDGLTGEQKKMAEKMMGDMKGVMKDMTNDMVAAVVTSCKEDKWADDAVKCFNEAEDEDAADKCKEMGTEEQKKKLEERTDKVMEKYKDKMPGMRMD